MKEEKKFQILIEILQEIYQQATPKEDFKKNLMHRKDNYFQNYTIEEETYNNIIKEQYKKYKITGLLKKQFNFSILLGPSPKFSSHI